MKRLFLFALCCSVAVGRPKSYASDYGYSYNPVALYGPNFATSSQFHAQDEFGQYNYGYSNPTSAKVETKTADGAVRGSYSYIDANGEVQQVNYIADILGFRTVATNLPVAPQAQPVAYTDGVRAVPIQQVMAEAGKEEEQVQNVPDSPVVLAPTVAYSFLPYATQYQYYYNPHQTKFVTPVLATGTPIITAPAQQVQVQTQERAQPIQPVAKEAVHQVPVAPAPVVAPPQALGGPPGVTQTQYHAQDEFGQYSFGYADPNSARTETKTADGVVQGSYNYVDSEGQIQTVFYIADALGFRVTGTNIPVAKHSVPVPVVETPEVQAARVAHLQYKEEHSATSQEKPQAPVYGDAVQFPAEVPAIPLDQLTADPLPVEVPATEETAPIAPAPAPPAPVQPAAEQPAPVDPVPVGTAIPKYIPATYPVYAAPSVPVLYTSYPAYAPTYSYLLAPDTNSNEPIEARPLAAGTPINTQFHAQDEFGQYNYGYSNPLTSKQETKSIDGVVRGTYSYVDANGQVQTVNYISDALGFRAAGTNIPVGPGDADKPMIEPQVAYSYLPYAVNHPYAIQQED